MNVEWKEIHPNYIVSSEGQIGSRWSGKLRIMKPAVSGKGYLAVVLCLGMGKRRRAGVHVLIAEAFLGPKPTSSHEVNHKNGIRIDNRDRNLEWCTPSENRQHAFSVLGRKSPRGEKNGQSKLTEADVREIRAHLAMGETHRHIATAFKIGKTTVGKIALGQYWGWLA